MNLNFGCSQIQLDPSTAPIEGQGGTKVYKGIIDGLDVAIKRVPGSSYQTFEKESSLISNLKHQSVIRFLRKPHVHVIDGENVGCLIMPWHPKNLGDVFEVVKRSLQQENFPKIHEQIVRKYLLPLAEALSYVHDQGIAHRDVKPSNILLDRSSGATSIPVLADFGVGKNYRSQTTTTMGPWASRGYTPEDPGDGFQQDVYSFGVVALELLTGRRCETPAERNEALTEESGRSRPLVNFLRICLAQDPSRRYANMQTCFAALLEATIPFRGRRLQLVLAEPTYQQIIKSGFADQESPIGSIQRSLSAESTQIRPVENSANKFDIESVDFSFRCSLDSTDGYILATGFKTSRQSRGGSTWKVADTQWNVVRPQDRSRLNVTKQDVTETTNLLSALNTWIEEGSPDLNSNLDAALTHYLDRVEVSLDALEKVLTGSGLPLPYKDAQSLDGGDAYHIVLDTYLEESLDGTNWNVDGVPGLMLTVVQSESDALAVRLTSNGRAAFPKKGKLTPALDVGSRIALERKRDALASIRGARGVNSGLVKLLTTTLGSADAQSEPEPMDLVWKNPSLDGSQRAAIVRALSTEHALNVQGPPGTGKTTFIVELINQILEREPAARILLVSQTHVALDNALTRLGDQDQEFRPSFSRLGNPDLDVYDPRVRPFLVSRQLENWASNLEEKSRNYAVDLVSATLGVPYHQAMGMVSLRELTRLYKELNQIEQRVSREGAVITDDAQSRMSALKREITLRKNNLPQQIVGLTNVSSLEECEAAEQTHGLNIPDTSGGNVLGILREREAWIKKITVASELEALFLRGQSVLAGTCMGFLSNPHVKNLQFNYCILDEASRSTVSESLVPLVKANRLIMVGDSKQLGPSTIELYGQDRLLSEFGTSRSEIDQSLFAQFEQNLGEANTVVLRTQYRMDETIGQLVSHVFYGGKLYSSGPRRKENLNFVESAGTTQNYYPPIKWLDTSGHQNRNHSQAGTSIINKVEAEEIRRSLEGLSGYLTEVLKVQELEPEFRISVLVIAPYSAQVKLLKRELDQSGNLACLEVETKTIDQVQGREADLVFFSATRSSANPESTGFVTEARLNVALSRARNSLVIVGDAPFWDSGPTKLSEVLEYCKELEPAEFELEVLGR